MLHREHVHPDPILLSDILASMRADLMALPHAMVGEVGLDRSSRIPFGLPFSPPYALRYAERRDMSPFTIPLAHQLPILEAQLDLAVELRRNVSVHSVQCQQATVELIHRAELSLLIRVFVGQKFQDRTSNKNKILSLT